MPISRMNSEDPHAVEFKHGSGEDITVWVGTTPSLIGSMPRAGHLFVVESEPEKARELRQVLEERAQAWVYEEVLAAKDGAMVQWHHFNDVRLSGPIDLVSWQVRFRNLRQTEGEQRCGKSLGALLDDWSNHAGIKEHGRIHLMLRQGDPLAAMVGLGAWLSHLETVHLLLPWPEETMHEAETWLKEHHFSQDHQSTVTWKQDAIATRDWLLKEKENEIQALITANQLLHAKCEVMQTEQESLMAERERISAVMQDLREAQALTQAETQQARSEAEGLRVQQEDLQREHQQLINDKSMLVEKLQTEEASNRNMREALKSLFPFERYRRDNVDLGELNEEGLAIHYLEQGQHQDRLKTYQELDSELRASCERRDEAESKLEQLEFNFSQTKQQLETLKDLFVRITEEPRSQRRGAKK